MVLLAPNLFQALHRLQLTNLGQRLIKERSMLDFEPSTDLAHRVGSGRREASASKHLLEWLGRSNHGELQKSQSQFSRVMLANQPYPCQRVKARGTTVRACQAATKATAPQTAPPSCPAPQLQQYRPQPKSLQRFFVQYHSQNVSMSGVQAAQGVTDFTLWKVYVGLLTLPISVELE